MQWSTLLGEGLLNWQEYAHLFVGLYAMLNVSGNLSNFLGATARFDAGQKRKCALVATLTVFLVLSIFALVGDVVLSLFGISIANVRIAGGLVLLFFSLKMMGILHSEEPPHEEGAGNPIAVGVSPIGMPLLAGPGAISTVIIYAQIHETPGHSVVVQLTILAVCCLLFISLQIAAVIGHRLNETATTVISRTTGLIVASVAMALVTTGIKQDFGLS
jgi:multiple antibiotic resistance protein